MNFTFATFEEYFWKLWNALYEYLCEVFDTEPNPDWYAPLSKEK